MRSVDSLRQALRASDWISDPFPILSGVATMVSSSPDLARELVIRALDQREELESMYGRVLDELAVKVGLYPYVRDLDGLSLKSAISHAGHRADGSLSDFVLHRSQARILRRLIKGESVILSAPTSFGKSLLIDLTIAARDFSNIVLVVPTLALVEETRRRMAAFADRYRVITTASQQLGERNIFVLTQERYLSIPNIPSVDFFVIDEFYKLQIESAGDRATQLNHAFLKLLGTGAQFYLLGPSIREVPRSVIKRTNCAFLVEDFETVALEVHQISPQPSKEEALAKLLDVVEGQTLIYCQSPSSARRLLTEYLQLRPLQDTADQELLEAAEWTGAAYHDDWKVSIALQKGIGVHHGRLPRSLGRFMIRAFEEKRIKILICTSTLIEGVNTSAKNVVIFDNKIEKRKLDFFTYNNIKGRSGRMLKHFVGNVYCFAPPPSEELPFVDIPSLNPSESTPTSLLLEVPAEELSSGPRAKVRAIVEQNELPLSFLSEHKSIEPERLIETAELLSSMGSIELTQFVWVNRPQYEELNLACSIIWNELGGAAAARQSSLKSSKMMTKWLWDLYKSQGIPRFRPAAIQRQIDFGETPDDAVENVLAFLRGWASFNFPKYLAALGDIVNHVGQRRGLTPCNYLPFAAAIEHFFQPSSFSTLEEYGLPFEISQKLLEQNVFRRDDSLDSVINVLKSKSLERFAESRFEQRVIEDFQEGLGARRIREKL